MQQTSYKSATRLWYAIAKKVVTVFLSVLLGIVLLFAVFSLGEQLVDHFLMYPAHIGDCLNGGGTWFYELNGCSG